MDIQTINTSTLAAASAQAAGRSPPTTAPSTPPAVEKPVSQTAVTRDQLQRAVDATNEFVQPINSAINFSVDKDSGEMIVKVTDKETKEVIRQIPSEEMLAVAQALDKLQGLLIKQKA